MATYRLPYAQEHLEELFEEARTGEDVIIVRFDGRSCQLLPLADVKSEAPLSEKLAISDLELPGSLVPARSLRRFELMERGLLRTGELCQTAGYAC